MYPVVGGDRSARNALVAELVDALASGASSRKGVGVRVSPKAQPRKVDALASGASSRKGVGVRVSPAPN